MCLKNCNLVETLFTIIVDFGREKPWVLPYLASRFSTNRMTKLLTPDKNRAHWIQVLRTVIIMNHHILWCCELVKLQ